MAVMLWRRVMIMLLLLRLLHHTSSALLCPGPLTPPSALLPSLVVPNSSEELVAWTPAAKPWLYE